MLKRKIIISAGLILLCIVGMIIFYVFDPEAHTFFPKCPFLVATGYECPGCGSQRAIHRLLHFDVKGAFVQNTLILFLVPYLLFGAYLAFFGGKERFPRLEKNIFRKVGGIHRDCVNFGFWGIEECGLGGFS